MGDATGAVHQLFRGDTPLVSNIDTLHLTREQALRFHDGLLALVEEFQTDATESTTPYSFAVMLVKGEVG